jgi:hypothetical protein
LGSQLIFKQAITSQSDQSLVLPPLSLQPDCPDLFRNLGALKHASSIISIPAQEVAWHHEFSYNLASVPRAEAPMPIARSSSSSGSFKPEPLKGKKMTMGDFFKKPSASAKAEKKGVATGQIAPSKAACFVR